jgi:hypothetical protein
LLIRLHRPEVRRLSDQGDELSVDPGDLPQEVDPIDP